MKKDSLIDYLGYTLLKTLGPLLRLLPIEASLFLGRRLGDAFYYFDLKHRARVYANIKIALGNELTLKQISKTTKDFYHEFGQSIIEIFLIPKIDSEYLKRNIEIIGSSNAYEALKQGKGLLLLGVHAGSWELGNIICANIGFPFILFVRGQRYPKINKLLNDYRRKQKCKILTREDGLKGIISALKNNQAIGITADQGGKSGSLVNFFGRRASMPTGAMKLALKYNCPVVPVFFTRVKGPKIKIFVDKQLELSRSDDENKDILDNLQRAVLIFEDYIRKYPKDYLWTYKIWKYSDQKNVLILSDSKAGHLRQSEAVLKIIKNYYSSIGNSINLKVVEVSFKNYLSKLGLILSSSFAGKYSCQGCLWCIKKFLGEDTYSELKGFSPDVVISCGSALAHINYIVSRENLSKSIVIMRPSILSMDKFDLIISPRHDRAFKNKNVVITEGALNLIDEQYLREQVSALGNIEGGGIGLLIGGNNKKFTLKKETVAKIISEVKSVSLELKANVFVTTSRRTPEDIEDLIKKEFKSFERCKLLVIANEFNIPEAVGGILGLSRVVICSPESISMVSEAATSKKHVLVFKASGLGRKHRDFLNNLDKKKYINLVDVDKIEKTIQGIWQKAESKYYLEDSVLVRQRLKKIL